MLAHNVYNSGRYALAFIKKSGSSNKIQGFLALVFNSKQDWSKEHFDELYQRFTTQHAGQHYTYSQASSNTAPTYANIGQQPYNQNIRDNTHSDLWDCLLLQCWLNSLFGGCSHTTVNNTTNFYSNGDNNSTNYTDKKKESEDGKKLLAAGIVVAVAVAVFHISMCYWYHSSKKTARESKKMDYLDNKLKTFRNIEFLGAFVSLAGLIACVVYPVLPAWGLVALGVHFLVCFMGGLAFHMKHERESEDMDAAKSAVENFFNNLRPTPNPGVNPNAFTDNNSRPAPSAPDPNDFSHDGPPPPYPGFNPNVFPDSQCDGVGVTGGQQPRNF